MAVIVGAARTAVVPCGGGFSALGPHELAAPVIRHLLDGAGMRGDDVGQIFLSNALGGGGNPARMAALFAGLGHVSGISIDAQCCGGLDAVAMGAAYVDAGFASVVIAGGSESYSQRPLRARRSDDGPPEFYTQPPFSPFADQNPDMSDAADDLARKLGISRQAQDAYAVASHQKALSARETLRREIVPVLGHVDDAFTRPLSEAVAKRAKVVSGSVSVASTAVEADGAAFCLIVADHMRDAFGHATGIRAHASVGDDPTLPGIAPVRAIARLADAFERDLAIVELMEAYSAQAIACEQLAKLPSAKTNISGGALSRGHPIGASGTILVCRAFHELGGQQGTALCAIAGAGGIGSALVLQTR